ncbi:S-adenosyl-L-methionine-dependent methyltransferase [Gongronella butleri]|nr:S-adenosyl-L-methionine-dependent methyltransferase [Gongronella butleri]
MVNTHLPIEFSEESPGANDNLDSMEVDPLENTASKSPSLSAQWLSASKESVTIDDLNLNDAQDSAASSESEMECDESPDVDSKGYCEVDVKPIPIVIEILGWCLNEVKSDVTATLLRAQGKPDDAIPDIPMDKVGTALFSIRPQTNDQGPETELDPAWAAENYVAMTSFMSVYMSLLEVMLLDIVSMGMEEDSSHFAKSTSTRRRARIFSSQATPMEEDEAHRTVNAYFELFERNEHFIGHVDDPFTWFYAENRTTIVNSLSSRFKMERNIVFTSIKHADTILREFYTQHLLRPVARQHQRNHGQYYTPLPMIDFMWRRCFHGDDVRTEAPLRPMARVLDPCMGTGSFHCKYLMLLVEHLEKSGDIWNDGDALGDYFAQLPGLLWGIEIDPFAFRLGKINIFLHLFPLFQRVAALGTPLHGLKMYRLCLFQNDTLLMTLPDPELHPWEHEQILKFRDPKLLKFDYIVTNPPYMTRWSGFNAQADFSIFDHNIFSGMGSTQVYYYFIWLSLQRLDPENGQLCFITPTQWTMITAGENIRNLLWEHAQLLDFICFRSCKVWRSVQTDSLVFRLRLRHKDKGCPPVVSMQHRNNALCLQKFLDDFERFDPFSAEPNPDVHFKLTPTDDLHLPFKTGSLTILFPSSSAGATLVELVENLPRLCNMPGSPLSSNIGGVFTPLYGMVVRTAWARAQFGKREFKRYLKPIFYWNWSKNEQDSEYFVRKQRETRGYPGLLVHSNMSKPTPVASSNDRMNEMNRKFWQKRDPARISKREYSPAEAYAPFPQDAESTYSLIMVDKKRAKRMDRMSPVYKHLMEVRAELRPKQDKRKIAWTCLKNSGIEHRLKIVHPNHCHFSTVMPRQRFFLDTESRCLPAACTYFTLNVGDDGDVRNHPIFQCLDSHDGDFATQEEDAYYFYLGLLNSFLMRIFIRQHCRYDTNGRMRLSHQPLKMLPYAAPTPEQAQCMVLLVRVHVDLRKRINAIVAPLVTKLPGKPSQVLLDAMRNYKWKLDQDTKNLVNANVKLDNNEQPADNAMDQALARGKHLPADHLVRLFCAHSLTQHAIEHVACEMYKVDWQTRLGLEEEHGVDLSAQWQWCQELLHLRSPLHIAEEILAGTFDENSRLQL